MRKACEIGLKPREFWALTPYEFGLMVEGYYERQRDAHRVQARYTAALMNCWRSKGRAAVQPRDLLRGIEKRGTRHISLTGMGSLDDIRQELRQL